MVTRGGVVVLLSAGAILLLRWWFNILEKPFLLFDLTWFYLVGVGVCMCAVCSTPRCHTPPGTPPHHLCLRRS